MATSQNGHPVIFSNRTTGELPRLRKWVIPGSDRHFLLVDGSRGFILAHFLLYFHERVESLDKDDPTWDDWGWAVRAIRGKTSGYSNHASGTAADANATQHPLGKVNTFGPRQRRRIRRRLAAPYMGGAIRWGGDYNGRKDEMHFEIVKNLRACERIAKVLMRTPRGREILCANPGAKQVILS